MAQIDTYRSAVLRKKQELAKLNQALAKEQAKIAPLESKINSANSAISRAKNASTVKTKISNPERCQAAGSQSEQIADCYDKSSFVDKIEDIYETVVP